MTPLFIASVIIINSYSVGPPTIVTPDPGNFLQEDGTSKLLQQDGTSKLVKEFAAWVQGNLLQQDGTSKIMQQDGTSIIKTQ
jgi:hypothetical protein